jgi:formylglycine-generating enzyme required for sulfatase activity
MVRVPAGTYAMGEGSVRDQKHDVKVDAFWMDKLEVAVEDYRRCVEANACDDKGLIASDDEGTPSLTCNWAPEVALAMASGGVAPTVIPDRHDHPINCIEWEQAMAYCKWAGKRLPTEEEWEYAARGTDGRKWPWGNDRPDAKRACIDRKEGTCPVGRFPSGASPFGLLDMEGNVWEWTSNSICEYLDPQSCWPSGHIFRGDGWGGRGVELYHRAIPLDGDPAIKRGPHVGFRCAKSDELPSR